MVEQEGFVHVSTPKHSGFMAHPQYFDVTADVIGMQHRLQETQFFLQKNRLPERDKSTEMKNARGVESAYLLRRIQNQIMALREQYACAEEKGYSLESLQNEEANLVFRLLLARRSIDSSKPGSNELAENIRVQVHTFSKDEVLHQFSANVIEVGVSVPSKPERKVIVKSRIPAVVLHMAKATGFDMSDHTSVVRGLVQGNNPKIIEERCDAFVYRRGMELSMIDNYLRGRENESTVKETHRLKVTLAADLLSLWLDQKSGNQTELNTTGLRVGVVKSEKHGVPDKLQFSVTADREKFVSRISAPWLPAKSRSVDRMRALLERHPDIQWDYVITERLY